MAEAKQAWDEVTERFGTLSRRMRAHYEEETAGGGAGSGGGAGHGDGKAVEEALRTLSEAVNKVVSTVTTTVHDPEFADEAKRAGQALANALSASFDDIGGEIRNRVGSGSLFGKSDSGGPKSSTGETGGSWPSDTPEPPVRP
jgi:hypothetical protein